VKEAAFILALLLTAVGVPVIVTSLCRERVVCALPASHTCVNNLMAIDGAKQQWALEGRKGTNDTPNMKEIARFLRDVGVRAIPVCPAGGVYMLGRVCESPKCTIKGHALP